MSDDDPPLTRVRRAKSRPSAPSRIDGGAVAVGLIITLGAHLVPALLVLVGVFDTLFGAAALASTLAFPVGSYVTGKFAGGNSVRGGVHGLLTAAVSLVILAGGSALFVGADGLVAELGKWLVADSDITVLAGTVVCLLLVGALTGALGSKRVSSRQPND